jgi:hypothetical protein
MDNELVNAKQVEVQMRFAMAAAKVLGITALELAMHADNEPNLQMLVEQKAISFGNRYNENKPDVDAIREYSQKRADAIRAVEPDRIAESSVGLEAAGDAAWFAGLDELKTPA